MNEATVKFFENLEAKNDISMGAGYAIRNYETSCKEEAEIFNVSEIPSVEFIPDLIETLKSAGVKTFAVTEESTALLRSLKAMTDCGCRIEGVFPLKHLDRFNFYERVIKEKNALKLIIE